MGICLWPDSSIIFQNLLGLRFELFGGQYDICWLTYAYWIPVNTNIPLISLWVSAIWWIGMGHVQAPYDEHFSPSSATNISHISPGTERYTYTDYQALNNVHTHNISDSNWYIIHNQCCTQVPAWRLASHDHSPFWRVDMFSLPCRVIADTHSPPLKSMLLAP